MNTEQIQKFLADKTNGKEQFIKIAFKTRTPVLGLFITNTQDFSELKSKNFWRIVTKKNAGEYKESGNLNYSRLFNGSEFTKLSLLTEEYES